MLHLLLTALLGIGLVASSAQAQTDSPPRQIGPWAIGVFAGIEATDGEMFTVFRAIPDRGERQDRFAGVQISRELARFWGERLSLEAEVGVGSRFQHLHGAEGWAAIFLRYHGFPWDRYLVTTIAASTGVNYATRLPLSELDTPDQLDRHKSRLLHYLAAEITFALPDHRQHEVFFRLHHRSGVFGAFDGVRGGADVITFGYRYRF